MTPPVAPNGTAPLVAALPSEGFTVSRDPAATVRPQPLRELRPEFRNPFRSTRAIQSFGDIREAFVEDLIRKNFGGNAEVIQLLGSFPGWNHPERRINEEWTEIVKGKPVLRGWKPNEKPDFNVVGDAQEMLKSLQPIMGWNAETLEANLARAQKGMVYFNQALETPAGPVPFKMGIIDRRVVFGGEDYFSQRDWLLPAEAGHIFLHSDADFQGQFEGWIRANKADYLRRALGTFLFRTNLSVDDLVQRSFRVQFRDYEPYRVFEWFAGPSKAKRVHEVLPQIFVPAIQQYLREHQDLKAYHSSSPNTALQPDQITEDNFRGLNFVLERSVGRRVATWLGVRGEILVHSFNNAVQSFRNTASNGTRRRGHQDVGGFEYLLRKVKRGMRIKNETFPRDYRPEASSFSSDAERLGRTETPLRQMVILAGYDAGNEDVPAVYEDILKYAEKEVKKGAHVNPLFKGVDPSKFTLPIRGVPCVAYQMMNWLESDGIQHLTIAGADDVRKVYERFVKFYSAEIEARGKTHSFAEMGPSFTANLRKGVELVPDKGEQVVVGFGDTPLIDMERIAHHPHRHVVDWIAAVNSRGRMLHDGGKNYHFDGLHEGVYEPVKEANAYSYFPDVERIPWGLLQALYDSRKSMAEAGSRSKFGILMEMLFAPQRRLYTYIDSFQGLGRVAVGAVPYQIKRRFLKLQVPQLTLPLNHSEHVVDVRVNWTSSLFPNHSDPGGVLDIDGVFDLAIAKGVMEETSHPELVYPHWEKLAPFAEHLAQTNGELPALTGTAERINRLYERLRQSLLEKGHPPELLRNKGFCEIPPLLADGQMNPAFMELVLPPREFQFYRLGFEAYQRRGEHAKSLIEEFQSRIEATQAPGEGVNPKVEALIWRTLNGGILHGDPDLYRSMIIEWNFGQFDNAMRDEAAKEFGVGSPEAGALERYLDSAHQGNVDSPLRRVCLGLKAVDVLRRSLAHLSPEELRTLYPNLVEALDNAGEAIPSQYRRLRGYFSHAQTTADRAYVRQVGESPPPYRRRGLPRLYAVHSNNRPAVRTDARGEELRVDSAAMLPQDVADLARRLNIMPSRVPHLIAAAAGADSPKRLQNIVGWRLTPKRLLAWAQDKEGRAYLKARGGIFEDNFRNRVREGGPGLAAGIASLLGAENLADILGLDAQGHSQERFMFVVGLSHLANKAMASVNEVVVNRSLGQPFHFVTTRAVSAGGEAALQYTFEAQANAGRALAASLARNFHLQGTWPRIGVNILKGTATLPFRTCWGMGPGLMSAALVDRTIGNWFFDESPKAREWLHFGSFFLPDVYRIAVGNRGPMLFRGGLMRGASRAFAAGSIADMVFLGGMRVKYGSEGSAAQNAVFAQANELRDADRGWWSRTLDGAFEMVAPAFSAYWDSVEFKGLNLKPNGYQEKARKELRDFSRTTADNTRGFLQRALILGAGDEALTPAFYTQVDYGFLRGDNILSDQRTHDGRILPVEAVLQQLSDPEIHRRVMVEMNPDQQIAYIRRQFRGHRLSRTDAEAILNHITLHRLRSDVAQLESLPLPENRELQELFDGRGKLRETGKEGLGKFAFGASTSEEEILGMRRVGLATRILKLRGESPQSKELQNFERVGRQLQLLDAEGRFSDAELEAQARAQIDPSSSAA